MSVFKKGRKWFHDWRDRAGRRHRKSHNTAQDANRADRSIKKWKRHDGPKPRGVALHQIAAHFLATKTGLCPSAYQSLARTIERCLATLKQADPARLEAHHFADFRAAQRAMKPNTRHGEEINVRAFLKYAHQTGQLPTPPDELYPRTRHRQELRQIIVDPPTTELMERTATGCVLLLYVLGRYAGCRIAEVARATAGDYNATSRMLTIRTVKSGADRNVPANPPLHTYLTALVTGQPTPTRLTALANPRGHALTRGALGKLWNAYRQTIGAHRINPHDLRRTFATDVSQHCSIATLMQLCGWRTVKSAIPYLVPNAADRHAAIRKTWAANPRALENAEPEGGIS